MKSPIVLLCAICLPVMAQWNVKTPGVPRLPNGEPDMNAPAPRMPDGKPNLEGIWEPNGIKYLINIAADLKPGDVPFRPEAATVYNQRRENNGLEDPDARCLPSGMPRKDAITSPYKILQNPGFIVFLYESRTTFRQIFTDGRAFPKDMQPAWDGYSIGHWDGDTLVVETRGMNGRPWLDSNGHPLSDAMHLIEKFRRLDFGHMEIEITLDDPKMYTRPWTIKENPHLLVDTELIEYSCFEDEKDLKHLVGK